MKLLLKSLGFVLLFIFLILVIIVLIPDSTYKNLAEKSFQKFTDRTLRIGELNTKRNLNPTIELNNVALANPDWAEKKEMLTADQLNASLDLIELIKGNLNIDLSSDTLNIDLLRKTQEQNNWQFKTDESKPKTNTENPSVESLARFVLKHLNMNDFKVSFTDEPSKTHHELTIMNMEVIESDDGIAQNIKLDGFLDNLPLGLTGSTGTFREFGENKILPVDLQLSLDNVALLLKGNIDAQSDAFNIASDIQVSAPDLGIINKFTDQKLPSDWRDINGSAKLVSKSGVSSLDNIKLTLDGGLKLDIVGKIADIAKLQGVDATVKATLISVNGLSAFTAEPLPDIGPINFSGKVASNSDKYSLNDARLSYDGEYGTADITGDVGDLINVDLAKLKADLSLPNLNIVKLFSDAKMPALGEIRLSSELMSDGPLDLSANNVNLDYDHKGLTISSTGSINSIIKSGGELNLDINAKVNSLDALNELASTELPPLGPVDLKTNINGTFTEIRINQIVADIKDKLLSGTIKGDIGAITNLDEISIKVDLASTSLADLLTKLGIESPLKASAKFVAAVQRNNNDINISGLNLDLDGNVLNGEIALQNVLDQTQRQKLAGTLNVAQFNLDEVLDTTPAEEPADTTEKAGMAIPDTPLPFNYIRDYDLDLTIDIDKFSSRFLDLSNTDIKLVADQGKFNLGPIKTKLNDGDTSIEASIDAATTPATLSINSEINGFSMKQAGTFEGSELLENQGSANAKLDITGTGESLAAILATANGGGEIHIENLAIKNEMIKFISGDLATEALAKLNPLDKKSDHTKINCTAAKFDIKQGQFNTTNGFIADSEAFAITGEAKIDFKDQGIDVKVNTNPKEGLGLGLGDLARAIQIKGTLAAPKVALNPEGIAELGATIGAAVATGGVSLLAQGQIEKLKANSEVCSDVLK